MISAGDVLRIGDSGAKSPWHYFVVISDPNLNSQKILLVCFTTWEDWKDDTCHISPADGFSFIRHQSCVDYAAARTESAQTLKRMMEAGAAKIVQNVGPDLLARIRKGARETNRLASKYWILLNDQELI